MAVEDVRDVGLLDFRAREVHPYAALVALDHGPSSERLPTVTGDQVPGIVTYRVDRRRVKAIDTAGI